MARAQEQFATITTRGALLPPNLLARIAANDSELHGLGGEDYHLAPGERLGEMINRSWNRMVGAWASFRPSLQGLANDQSEALTRPTRERWLLVLLQELGFGRLQTARPIELDGRAYPVSHLWGSATRVPFHLVGAGIDLDNRTAGVVGAARGSPHSLVQELLNKWDEALWGVVSNGVRLRLLRDNAALTRQAFVEFDLEAMMEGEVYSDFVLLWLLLHESRFEAETPADCWLERWMKEAEAQGTRALDHLRDGVERAIVALGGGFLAHPTNGDLRQQLRTGQIETQQYYRLLLRFVYRLLFLFVAEGRELLLLPDASAEARERYLRYYSMARMRRLAERRRGTPHSDLFESLKVVMAALDETGLPALGLPALGSMLWSRDAIGALGECRIANHSLLHAVHALAFVESADDRVIRPVDYRNLGPEELGSVYESLLELHPALNVDAASFELATASGHERKTTGSYYTPTPLITSLLDTALEPVLDEVVRRAARGPDREQALLSLKVVDPACGSGHFLLAAAQRIARRLAAARTGDDEPSPRAMRTAVRDVIANCIYAVDVNPMAVELCKVSLWMESLEPGRPLSFLDHRIQCGHSLLGATPRLLSEGIPDGAFKPIAGDDKTVATSWRKRNKAERAGQLNLALAEEVVRLRAPLAARMADVEQASGDSVGAVREQERRYRKLVESADMRRAWMTADAWCAAFAAPKVEGEPVITERALRGLAANPDGVALAVRERVEQLADRYRFFHWYLAFPDVFRAPGNGDVAEDDGTGWSGGFDVVLGNPPWERVKLQEQEFFSASRPEIAGATGADRKALIQQLAVQDPSQYAAYRAASRRAEVISHFLHTSNRNPLCGRGDINTYSVFAETMASLTLPTGRVGCIVPSGIATDHTTKDFFESILTGRRLVSLFEFSNRGFFPAAGDLPGNRFCLLTLTGTHTSGPARFLFGGREVSDVALPSRVVPITPAEVELLNPNTGTCPTFHTVRDKEITTRIYHRAPILAATQGSTRDSPWGLRCASMFHMTNDSKLFRTVNQLEAAGLVRKGHIFRSDQSAFLPLYEAKMVDHYNHRHGDYLLTPSTSGRQVRQLASAPVATLSDPEYVVQPHYWVAQEEVSKRIEELGGYDWFIAWRDVTDARASERTVVPCIIPATAVGNSLSLALIEPGGQLGAVFVSGLSSIVFDYIARQKLAGTHLNYFIMDQLPFPRPEDFLNRCAWSPNVTVAEWISQRVLELVYTAWDLKEFAADMGYYGAPFAFEVGRRARLRDELDGAWFHIYGVDEAEVEYILSTFPVLRRREQRECGFDRTARSVMSSYQNLRTVGGRNSR